MKYARGGGNKLQPLNLNYLVKETSETFGAAKKDIKIHTKLADKLHGVRADQGQLEQTLLNLYVNAADAMPDGGDLFIEIRNVTDMDMLGKPYKPKPGNYLAVTIKDTGTGMDGETMERIFEPFFTTKGLARGTGLGLASTYGIVKGHGGYIDVDSEKGHGTTFSIYLPATKGEIIVEKELSYKPVPGNETILFVDDEDMVLDAGEQMLKRLNYKTILARNGQEALELYEKNQNRIDMVILDIVMPDMGGGKTYEGLKNINPDIKVLLSSGYGIDGPATEILKKGCNAFIQKPFNLNDLSQKIRTVLDNR